MLELKDVHTYYGNIHALKGISLTVNDGEIVTLIGSNGAGKSTTLRTIQGLNKPRSGSVVLDGKELHKLPAHEIAALGVAQSPEGRMIFPRMTVMENLEMGAYVRKDPTTFEDDLAHVFSLFPRLKERITQKGGTLCGGVQQMLGMARALFPGAPASLDALCKRFMIDNGARTLHGALLDAQLLAEVYLELIGGRQPDLALAAVSATEDSTIIEIVHRAPRPHVASEAELAAHAEFLKKITNPIWLR